MIWISYLIFFDNLTRRKLTVWWYFVTYDKTVLYFEHLTIKPESGMRQIQNSGIPVTLGKANKWTQELIQSDPRLAPNTKEKDRK